MEVESFTTDCSSGHRQDKERKGRKRAGRVSKREERKRNRRREEIKGAGIARKERKRKHISEGEKENK